MPKIHVIHENDTWVEPLRAAFTEQQLPYAEWFLSEGVVDLSSTPPEGVFYNRMSASSHTRGHRFAPELTGAVLAWLGSHGRRVINDGRALALEISKVAQYEALRAHGIRTPRTLAAVGADQIVAAARKLPTPFITKHNRAGKGLGVRLFHGVEALEAYVRSEAFEQPIDGITLVQEYIRSPEPVITRVEFVGGRFLYAVEVDTSLGFELCPADVCQVGDAFCPVGQSAPVPAAPAPRFRIIEGFADPLVERYQRFLAANGIGIAGIEFVTDARGERYTYDVNTNTNYNSAAEAAAGRYGMRAIAAYLGRELARLYPSTGLAAAA
ncbi:MAG TPA: alpha-L-glutamate ligase [Casimicrobiaceae bacterium]|nr:alpha-L-glutamate ligase [Casimicrobiaceae bacterium]